MIIDGKELSLQILEDLRKRTEILKGNGILPHLYIILLSDNEESVSYVNQKLKKAEIIGAKVTVDNVRQPITTDELVTKIEKLNNDNKIHGIIVQRPMPANLNEITIAKAVDIKKDVDGFNPESRLRVPVFKAILRLLKSAHPEQLEGWLNSQKIVVIGKGITAGQPIISGFAKMGIKTEVITGNSANKNDLLKSADIIISAVGKPNIFNANSLKNGVIVLGVGLHKEADGKFYGDFNEEEIKNVATYYSPTPGGVGPVNVASLLENLVWAAEQSSR